MICHRTKIRNQPGTSSGLDSKSSSMYLTLARDNLATISSMVSVGLPVCLVLKAFCTCTIIKSEDCPTCIHLSRSTISAIV